VNDIFKYQPVEYLLLMDNIETFPQDRLKTIIDSTPLQTFSQLSEWNFMPGFTPIGLNKTPGDISSLGSMNYLPRHVDSTFTAVCIAYCLGAKKVVMYGVEFCGHPVLSKYSDKILECYEKLYKALLIKGCNLCVASHNSLLSEVMPVEVM